MEKGARRNRGTTTAMFRGYGNPVRGRLGRSVQGAAVKVSASANALTQRLGNFSLHPLHFLDGLKDTLPDRTPVYVAPRKHVTNEMADRNWPRSRA